MTLESDVTLRQQSPFLNPGAVAKANTLAIVQLSKDDFLPVYLRDTQGAHDGYKEGHVLNTRFGSFPHSTLIGVPWGSQVRASIVDTGTRGRVKKPAVQPKTEHSANVVADADAKIKAKSLHQDTPEGLKRKRDVEDEGETRLKSSVHREAAASAEDNTATEHTPIEKIPPPSSGGDNESKAKDDKLAPKTTTATPPAAQSGFVHILPPTPEIWTTSLPHRTQVVYTPDYSYILQRLRARPGTRIIEAGSGSGSFTHASARAVYNGVPSQHAASTQPIGKVFSYEFHEQRFQKMRREISEHGLSDVVEVNHRDVYNEGFLVDGRSPEADAVFLDLPAPWLALPHLSRRKPTTGVEMDGVEGAAKEETWTSPLNPNKSIYICTFSPCIEQVTRTVSEMRKLGWVEIDMVEISQKRINVYREKLGIDLVSDRGQQLAPKNVAEAVIKLREVEVKSAEHNAKMSAQHTKKKLNDAEEDMDEDEAPVAAPKANGTGNHAASDGEERKAPVYKPYMQGQLVTRSESEFKAHTSYLVFAILPREWTEEDEAAAAAKWPTGKEPRVTAPMDRASRKQLKRDLLLSKRKKNKKEKESNKKGQAADLTSGEVKPSETSTAGDVNMEEAVQTEVTE